MKKLSFMVFSFTMIALSLLSLIACDLNQVLDTDTSIGENITKFEVEVPIATSRSIHTDVAVHEVWVKVFDSNGNHVAATGNVTNGVSYLTKTGDIWSGSVLIPKPYPSNLTFSVWAENVSNEHLYSGSKPVVASAGTSVTIATASGYAIGALGPGGGKIIDAKDSAFFVANGWRYLEAAASDFSYTWANIPLDSNYKLDASGNVLEPDGDPVLNMTTAHWYWGPPDNADGNYGTLKTLGEGLENTDLLCADAVSGVTPKITKGTGRPATADNAMRRDLSKTLSGGNLIVGSITTVLTAQTIGGKNDWFVPSKDELNLIYTNKTALGITSGIYWSSSESAHSGDDPTSTITNSLGYDAVDLNSWVQNLETGAQYQELRNALLKVRPVRRF